MNNIVNIRMGHYVLATDEDAANMLRRYSESLRNRYRNEEGADEIVQDIEERIGELLNQKQTDHKRTFTILKDAEEVLAQMGPVDSDESKKETDSSAFSNNQVPPSRRLFRDTDNSFIGGVSAGLANYFNVDPVIIRLLWVVSVFVFGFGVPLYIVLWVIVPEAKTTAEKLMMQGQTPNIQNIEENVKAEFKRVEENFKSNGFGDKISSFITTLLKYLGKFILLVFKWSMYFALIVLITVLIALLVAFTSGAFHINTWNFIIEGQKGLDICLTAFGDPLLIKAGMLLFLLLSLIVIALRVFVPSRNTQQVVMTRRYLTGVLVVLSLALFISTLIGLVRFGNRSEKRSFTESFQTKGDTLYLASEGISAGMNGFYTCNYLVDVLVSEDSSFHLEQHNSVWGSARNIKNHIGIAPLKQFRLEKNHLWITECSSVSDLSREALNWSKFILYVPKGKIIKTDNRFFNSSTYPQWMENNQIYKIDSNGFSSPQMKQGQTIPIPESINKIYLEGNMEVQIIQSNKNKIELISGPVLTHKEWIDVDGNELTIENDIQQHIFNGQTSKIRVYVNDLKALDVSGVAMVWLRNINTGHLEISCNGASHVRGNIKADFINMDVEGVSEVALEGNTNKMEADIDGASTISCPNLKSQDVEINVSGTSSATVWATSRIRSECDGASKLYVKGKPSTSEIETDGISKYQAIE